MRTLKRLLVPILVVFLLASAIPAYAQESTPPGEEALAEALLQELHAAGENAGELWLSFTPEEQAAVIKYVTVSETRVAQFGAAEPLGGQNSPDTWYCMTGTVENAGYNLYGVKLYSYYESIYWCWDGTYVVDKMMTRWGDVYIPGWQFAGHIGLSEGGGVWNTYYRAFTQGEFKFCILEYGCLQHTYPWIDYTVYGDGTDIAYIGG